MGEGGDLGGGGGDLREVGDLGGGGGELGEQGGEWERGGRDLEEREG